MPLGFDCEAFSQELELALTEQWSFIQSTISVQRFWIPFGSGTLTKAFCNVLPLDIEIKCVDVRVLAHDDHRVQSAKLNSRVEYFAAPMMFQEAAEDLPPVPSNLFYDAKLWQFLNQHGRDGDIWWNVAK
jgi:hypothetical protein